MKRIFFSIQFLLITSMGLIAQNGIIKGRVFNSSNNDGLAFATVRVQDSPYGTYTDSLGNYEIKDMPPGLYNLEVTYTGFSKQSIFEIQVSNSKPAFIDVSMEEEATEVDAVEIIASPFNKTEESPVSLRTIGVNEIERNPGGNRDISRVIQSLPGVASTANFRNDIIIRGGSPNENRFYLDGIEVPNINHFATQGASGGPVGLINVNFIREVDLFTGAFPANRGNTLSSVMEIKQKNGREDRLGFNTTIGSSDLGITLDGPLGKKTTFLASARRSYLGLLFQFLGLPFLPNYNDFQFKTRTKFNSKNELTIIGLGAIDEFELNLEADSTDEQRYILGNLPVNTQWNYTVGANFKHFTENGYFTVVLSRNMLENNARKFENNDDSNPAGLILDYGSQESENKLRLEHTVRTAGFKINYGLNYEYDRYTNFTFNRISTPAGLDTINFDSKLFLNRYGAFSTVSRKFFSDRLVLALGLRMDGNDYSPEMSNPLEQISPRFSAAWYLGGNFSLNFNTGIYYQIPPYTVLGYRNDAGELENKTNGVKYVRSTHVVAGIEYNTEKNTKISLEGFYKDYDNYPLLLRDSISLANLGGDFGVVGNEPVSSVSEGRSYGIEFLLQQKLLKGFFGILSYTFVRSEFTDGEGNYAPSAWDNRHIITFTGGKKFKGDWEIGARFRYYGGAPYTPSDLDRSSLISVWDITGRAFPDYNQLNSLRLDAFHQLDLRLDKKWFFKKWSLNLYLDVQNVYNFGGGSAPYVDVVRDAEGTPLVDPNDPSRYQIQEIQSTGGTVLPTIGVVIEI